MENNFFSIGEAIICDNNDNNNNNKKKSIILALKIVNQALCPYNGGYIWVEAII